MRITGVHLSVFFFTRIVHLKVTQFLNDAANELLGRARLFFNQIVRRWLLANDVCFLKFATSFLFCFIKTIELLASLYFSIHCYDHKRVE